LSESKPTSAPEVISSGQLGYFATCMKGLEEAVARELRHPRIGAKRVEIGSSGVYFYGTQETGYRANLWLRSAVRVLVEVGRARTVGPDELYTWARKLPWKDLLRIEQTFSVEARVHDSMLTHSQYAAFRIKDALCDDFRERTGERPNVNVGEADLPLFLYLHRDDAVLYRDLSGQTLHKRGYRDIMHKSSLNETVAAGLLVLAGWDGTRNLLDPMCGSATFVIEAALMALERAPGLERSFPFERWPDFNAGLWRKVQDDARGRAKTSFPAVLMANDFHPGALELARLDAARAGVEPLIRFSQCDISDFVPPEPVRLVFTNPPWGERLDDPDLKRTWKTLAFFLKSRCPGSEAWVLSGNTETLGWMGLRARKRFGLRISKLDCKANCFEIPGTPRASTSAKPG